jgi:hypothetical protein
MMFLKIYPIQKKMFKRECLTKNQNYILLTLLLPILLLLTSKWKGYFEIKFCLHAQLQPFRQPPFEGH